MTLELYSQDFIFFVTYKLAPLARVFALGKPFQPRVILYSN